MTEEGQKGAYDDYGHLACADCKIKIVKEAKKLGRFALLRPNRIARKFAGLLCKECLGKIRGAMQK